MIFALLQNDSYQHFTHATLFVKVSWLTQILYLPKLIEKWSSLKKQNKRDLVSFCYVSIWTFVVYIIAIIIIWLYNCCLQNWSLTMILCLINVDFEASIQKLFSNTLKYSLYIYATQIFEKAQCRLSMSGTHFHCQNLNLKTCWCRNWDVVELNSSNETI